ncbi:MAG TPA: GtrA family protein [Candidatus Saccharimonadales bacterium]|jgi:putative flippase GtrA
MDQYIQQVRAFLNRPFGRYLLIGGGVYLFELLVIYIAQEMGASALVAVGLGFWLGLIVSFLLTKFVTFQDKRTQHRILIPQIIAVSLLVLFNFGFTLLVTALLSDVVPAAVTRTLALGITTIWNFYLYRTRIFKQV